MDRRTIYNHLFSQWVTHQPDALVVVVEGRSVTYRELDVTANAIMSKFHANEYVAVGIIMSHSTEMISAMLADFMVPEFFVKMEEIPLTRRGKVNDRMLPVVMKEGTQE